MELKPKFLNEIIEETWGHIRFLFVASVHSYFPGSHKPGSWPSFPCWGHFGGIVLEGSLLSLYLDLRRVVGRIRWCEPCQMHNMGPARGEFPMLVFCPALPPHSSCVKNPRLGSPHQGLSTGSSLLCWGVSNSYFMCQDVSSWGRREGKI